MIEFSAVAQLGGAEPDLAPPFSTFPPLSPPPSFDCNTIMIVNMVWTIFYQIFPIKTNTKIFLGASRIIATRVSNYCLFFNYS